MSPSGRNRQKPFHEVPLVLFTILGIAGAGLGSAHLIRAGLGESSLALSWWEGVAISVLLALGAIVSTGHLGRPLRAPRALRGVGRSPLTHEVLALGLALGAGLAGLLLPAFLLVPASWLGPLGLVASASSVAFLLAVGFLYDLPAQLGWRGPPVFQPLTLGTAWGLLAGSAGSLPHQGSYLSVALVAFLVVDLVLALLRMGSVWRPGQAGAPVHPGLVPAGSRLLAVRIVLAGILTPGAVLLGWGSLALVALTLALVMDRVAFYTLAVKVTTESEVARVEAML